METVDWRGQSERIRALEARTTTWLRVAVVQQVILVGLLASAYLSWGEAGHVEGLHATLEQGTRLDAHDARLDALELGRIKHDARLEVLERGTASHAHETRETIRQLSVAVADTQSQRPNTKTVRTPGSQPRVHERQLQAAENEDRAIIRVDAPDGRAQFVMGARAAVDNVIMEKEHADEGGEFTLSRNETRVLSVHVDGTLSVLKDPLHVSSAMASAPGAPLELRSSAPGAGVALQDQQTTFVIELDGSSEWSRTSLLVYTGDTVHWSWANYHNIVQVNDAGVMVAEGIRSGNPVLSSSFAYTFLQPGLFRFKSQAADDMRMTVEVREFAVRNGTLVVGGDLEVGGIPMAGSGFENEVRFFLSGSCPPGWTEATETQGMLLGSRGASDQVGTTKAQAGISATFWYHYATVSGYTGCVTGSYGRCSDQQASITAPNGFMLLACKMV